MSRRARAAVVLTTLVVMLYAVVIGGAYVSPAADQTRADSMLSGGVGVTAGLVVIALAVGVVRLSTLILDWIDRGHD